MTTLPAPTNGEQQNPAETPVNPRPESGVGPPRTYEFVPREPIVSVYARIPCGGGHSRNVVVATLFDAGSVNPSLRIEHPLGVNAVMQICLLVQERKHVEPGEHSVGG